LFYLKLLDYEAKAADQVPLLMRMNKDDLALEKTIMSGDTDLGEFFEFYFCFDVVAQTSRLSA